MENNRHKGFVVGSDQNPEGQPVWKVRVNDAGSSYDGTKLIVASVCDGLELARGLNVNFAIGTVDDNSGQKALRAVDVRLEVPDVKPQQGQPVTRR
jgi:hypothetical protein